MVSLYLAGHTQEQAGQMAGLDRTFVRGELKRRGIAPRGKFEVHQRYAIDHGYFDRIDAEGKAYWLGFIVADGCILETDYTLSFTLARVDAPHLEKMRAAAGAGNPVRLGSYRRNGREYHTCQLALRSKPIWEALQRLGVTFRKSPTVAPPPVPRDLQRHFWRGCFDGDGCLCRRSNGYWSASFVGNEHMVGGFTAFVRDRLGIDRKPSPHKGWLRQASYGGIDVPQQVARLLYSDSTVSLDRKRLLADQLLAEVPRRKNREQRSHAWITAEVLADLKAEHGSWGAVARHLKVTVPNLMHIRWRLAGRKRTRKPYVRRDEA